MTCENRDEAVKVEGDSFDHDLYNAMRQIFGKETCDEILYHHIEALHRGRDIRLMEFTLKLRDLAPEQRLPALIDHMRNDPDYVPIGNLPSTLEEARDQEGETYLTRKVRAEFAADLSKRLPRQFPLLHAEIRDAQSTISQKMRFLEDLAAQNPAT